MTDDEYEEAQRLFRLRDVIDVCRDLGAIDLRKPTRTLGFERRQERADDRPRTAPAWGVAPEERW